MATDRQNKDQNVLLLACKNGSFRKRENLHNLKTADLVSLKRPVHDN